MCSSDLLFIEHPTDTSNRPKVKNLDAAELPQGDVTKLPYTICGPYLKRLFDRAFIDGVHSLLNEVEKLGDEYDFSPKISYYISICMEEMVVNTMQMSKNDSRKYNVDVKIERLTDGEIVIRIRDDFIEFDPTAKTAGSALEAAEEESFNLLGIGIVKNVAKEYDYIQTIGFNNFRIVL